jgi:hypothetical protein
MKMEIHEQMESNENKNKNASCLVFPIGYGRLAAAKTIWNKQAAQGVRAEG